MGRPIKRKYFGVSNVNDSQNYQIGGGEGVQSITVSTAGSNYSQGLTATVAASTIGGTTATISSVNVYTANGAIQSATVGTAGSEYLSAPGVTLVKPANVVTTGTTYYASNTIVKVGSTTGLYVGMAANVGFGATTKITAIYTANSNVVMSSANTSSISGAPISFGDIGTTGALTAVLFSTTTTANTIQANAWVTGGTIGKVASVTAQKGSRRYKTTNADGSQVCTLIANSAAVSAKGPIGPGFMTITFTDSAGGTYLAHKIFDKTAILQPAAINGSSAGTQFTAYQHVPWILTGTPTVNVNVKISTDN